MTDDRTLIALDERGRAAAAGVRTAVADRPAPVFDADLVRIDIDGRGADPRPRRSRAAVGLLAAAAAVVVVVAAVVAATGTGDDDSTPPAARIPATELGRYVIDAPPAGYEVAAVVDQRGTARAAPPVGVFYPGQPAGPVTVYGPEDDPQIGVYAWPADSGTPDDPDDDVEVTLQEMDEVTAGGRRAWEWTGSDVVTAFRFVVEVEDGWYATVGGVRASRGELLAAAGTVEVDPGPAGVVGGARATVPPNGLTEGWSRLGEVEQYDLAPGIGALRADSGGWLVSYIHQEGDEQDVVYLTSTVGDPIRVRSVQLATDDTEDVTVRGHEAVVARTTFAELEPGFLSVTWEERPGEIVQIVSSEVVGRDALLAMAEDIRPADDAEVAELARRAGVEDDGISIDGGSGSATTVIEGDTFGSSIPAGAEDGVDGGEDPGSLVPVAQGTFSDGTTWEVLDGPGGLTFGTTAGGEGGFSGGGSASASGDRSGAERPISEAGYGESGEVAWSYGRIGSPEVVSIRIQVRGATAPVEATIHEADGVRVWVAELPAPLPDGTEEPALEVTAHRADGGLIATASF